MKDEGQSRRRSVSHLSSLHIELPTLVESPGKFATHADHFLSDIAIKNERKVFKLPLYVLHGNA